MVLLRVYIFAFIKLMALTKLFYDFVFLMVAPFTLRGLNVPHRYNQLTPTLV